jgi:Ribbon-helix-helix protein, copG family
MSDLQKTTLFLDRDDYARVKARARAEGRAPAELIREAVAAYVYERPAVLPRSLGRGRSGRKDLSERVDELLAGMGEDG